MSFHNPSRTGTSLILDLSLLHVFLEITFCSVRTWIAPRGRILGLRVLYLQPKIQSRKSLHFVVSPRSTTQTLVCLGLGLGRERRNCRFTWIFFTRIVHESEGTYFRYLRHNHKRRINLIPSNRTHSTKTHTPMSMSISPDSSFPNNFLHYKVFPFPKLLILRKVRPLKKKRTRFRTPVFC